MKKRVALGLTVLLYGGMLFAQSEGSKSADQQSQSAATESAQSKDSSKSPMDNQTIIGCVYRSGNDYLLKTKGDIPKIYRISGDTKELAGKENHSVSITGNVTEDGVPQKQAPNGASVMKANNLTVSSIADMAEMCPKENH